MLGYGRHNGQDPAHPAIRTCSDTLRVTCPSWSRSISRLMVWFRTIRRQEPIPKRWLNWTATKGRWCFLSGSSAVWDGKSCEDGIASGNYRWNDRQCRDRRENRPIASVQQAIVLATHAAICIDRTTDILWTTTLKTCRVNDSFCAGVNVVPFPEYLSGSAMIAPDWDFWKRDYVKPICFRR